jgi:hypothetical protein
MNPWHYIFGIVLVLILGWLNMLAYSKPQTNYYVPLCLEVPLDGRK